MNILTTSTSVQSLVFIPRNNVIKEFQDRVLLDGGTYITNNCFTPLEMILTSEDTNTSITYNVTAAYNNQELTVTQSFNLKEGVYYSYKVSDGVNLMYRGKIFCTDQTEFDKYVVNNTNFVEVASRDNEFTTA
jgi:hypothetical protein